MHTISPQRLEKRFFGLGALLRGFDKLVVAWRERQRQRFALSNLDDRLLRDIGVSREDAKIETTKPFWRP